jgi:hypothetical protein
MLPTFSTSSTSPLTKRNRTLTRHCNWRRTEAAAAYQVDIIITPIGPRFVTLDTLRAAVLLVATDCTPTRTTLATRFLGSVMPCRRLGRLAVAGIPTEGHPATDHPMTGAENVSTMTDHLVMADGGMGKIFDTRNLCSKSRGPP